MTRQFLQHAGRCHWVITFSLIIMMAFASSAQPDYTGFQLHARSNFSDACNLPDGAFFASDSPSINEYARFDRPEVVARIGVISGTDRQGVWYGQAGRGLMVYESADAALISNATINNAGLVVWEETFRTTEGLYFYDTRTGDEGLYTNKPFGASAWTAARVSDDGRVGFRATFGFSGKAYVVYDPDTNETTTYVSDADLDPDSPYSFLFTPTFNNDGEIAGKVRVGDPGQVGDEQPDEIRVFESDGSSTLVVRDRDADPKSPFAKFDNSVALSDHGEVAFTATLTDGSRGVYLWLGIPGDWLEIANTSKDPEITGIEFFAPSIVGRSNVTFRGVDDEGLQAIFVGDGLDLLRLIGEHDLIETDLGTARIDQHDESPVFSGGPVGNEFGDIAFKAALTPKDNNQIEWGTGLFVAMAKRALDLQVGNLRVGQRATFEIRSATPHRSAFVAYGFNAGQTFIPPLNVTLDISKPKLVGSAVANQNGFASFGKIVPKVPTPLDIMFEACEFENTSGVVRTQIRE